MRRNCGHFSCWSCGTGPSRTRRRPANFDDLPAEYIARLSKAIVAFEIEVETFDNVFKLSQNRNEKSYHNIIEALDKRNDPDSTKVAEEMKKRIEQMNANWHKE